MRSSQKCSSHQRHNRSSERAPGELSLDSSLGVCTANGYNFPRMQRVRAEFVENLQDLQLQVYGKTMLACHNHVSCKLNTRLLCRKSELPLSSILKKICSIKTSRDALFTLVAVSRYLRRQHLSHPWDVLWSWWSARPLVKDRQIQVPFNLAAQRFFILAKLRLSWTQIFVTTDRKSLGSVRHCSLSTSPECKSSLFKFRLNSNLLKSFWARNTHKLLEHVHKVSGRPVAEKRKESASAPKEDSC